MTYTTVIYSVLILLFLYALFTVGFPFLLAFLLAFLLEPLIQAVSKWVKVGRSYASIFICTVFTLLCTGLGYVLIAKVSNEAADMSGWLIALTKDLNLRVDQLINQYHDLFQSLPPEYQNTFYQLSGELLQSLQTLLRQMASLFFNLAKEIPNFFVEVIMVFIALYLISLHLPKMKKQFLNFFDPEVHSRLEIVLQKLQHAVFGFIRAQIIISSLVYLIVFGGFLILGVSYPSASALLVTIVDILPIFGTGAVMIPMALYHYFIGNVFMGLGIFVHYIVIIVFRRIIDPKILADSTGISALSALISMYLGFKLTGFIGLFLGPAVIILFQALIKVGILRIKIKF